MHRTGKFGRQGRRLFCLIVCLLRWNCFLRRETLFERRGNGEMLRSNSGDGMSSCSRSSLFRSLSEPWMLVVLCNATLHAIFTHPDFSIPASDFQEIKLQNHHERAMGFPKMMWALEDLGYTVICTLKRNIGKPRIFRKLVEGDKCKCGIPTELLPMQRYE